MDIEENSPWEMLTGSTVEIASCDDKQRKKTDKLEFDVKPFVHSDWGSAGERAQYVRVNIFRRVDF